MPTQVITLIVVGAIMFLVIGGLAFLSHYYTLDGIKSKTVGDGQHGTARWATKQEIRQTYAHVPFEPELWRKGEHLPEKQGLVLGCEGPKDHVTALVDTDDIHAMVTAASGAGKTTLLQIMGTLSRPDSGRVEIGGEDVSSLGDKALSKFRNERIGFVFQFHHLLAEFTAFENVCIPGLIGRRPRADVERRASELLDMMGGETAAN